MKENVTAVRESKLILGEPEISYPGRFITISKVPFKKGPEGKEGTWEVVTRTGAHGPIVGIIGVTSELNLILVKEYRVPSRNWVLSFCCGAIDSGESAFEAARRELEEETGYVAPRSRVYELYSGALSPALMPDTMTIFVAFGAEKKKKPAHGNAEDIEVVTYPLRDAYDHLRDVSRKVTVDIKLFGAVAAIERLAASEAR